MPPVDSILLTSRHAAAMARSMRHRMDVCRLELSGWVVVTEAATGAYASTAAAAAAAGAEVWAFAADSSFGTVDDIEADVAMLVSALGVDANRPSIVTTREELPLERTDLITNSGSLRPIDAPLIARLPPTATIALMYEAWEARDGDIDYARAAERGIRIVAVDEHHPACGAFDFLGDLVVAAALRRGWPIRAQRVAVFSDNPFGEPIIAALRSMGAEAALVEPAEIAAADVAVIAMTPAAASRNGSPALSPPAIAEAVIDTGAFGCIQLWGDIDTDRLRAAGVAVEPETPVRPGHQGIGMSEAGFEAVVRLQVGGLAAVLHVADADGPLAGLGQELVWSDV